MRVEGSLMPRVVRDRVERERSERQTKRTRLKRTAWLLTLASVLLCTSIGGLVGAILGAIEGVRHDWLTLLTDVAAGAVSGAAIGFGLLISVWLTPLIFFLVYMLIGASHHERMQLHSTFVVQLLDALDDDLLADRKVRVALDLSGYSSTKKITWSGRSSHGNPKHRYDDRWLDLRVRLVDGTRLHVRRTADVKTTKGSVVKEKRRLELVLRPARAVRFGPAEVESACLEAVASTFHNPPEGLAVRVTPSERGVRVKVMQLDAPILADEVVALVAAVLASAAPTRELPPAQVRDGDQLS